MPLVFADPVITPPVVPEFEDTVFSIVSNVGELMFSSSTDASWTYALITGTTGFGIPAELLRMRESPTGGAEFVDARIGVRQGVLSIAMQGEPEQMEDILRTLSAHLAPENRPSIVARKGEETYRLAFFRESGGEPTRSINPRRMTWDISIQCPAPFWVSDTPVTVGPVNVGGEQVGLLPDLVELPVSASSAFGSLEVTNPGDAPSPVNWTIKGPATEVTVILNGRGFTLAEIEAGEVITVTKTPTAWLVRDQDGENRYSLLGPAPKFPSAPVGSSSAQILAAGATAATSVSGFFRVLRKVVR